MSNWLLLFKSALVYGLGLSLVLTTIMIVSGVVAADMWVGDYPPDIRQRYGPMSPRAARLRPFFAASFVTAILVILILGLFSIRAQVDYVPFISAFAFSAITLLVFNTFDLFILDWLFFCTIQPRQMVLPGTEGMAGYHDYRFHFIGFVKGLGFCAVGGLLIAGLWMAAQGLTSWTTAHPWPPNTACSGRFACGSAPLTHPLGRNSSFVNDSDEENALQDIRIHCFGYQIW